MCCCTVDQCCCGCTDHKTGVMIWGIIDGVLNLIFFIFYLATIGLGGPQFWSLILFVASIFLVIGAWKSNTGLILVWEIIMMIWIVLLIISLVIIVPILLFVVILVDSANKAINDGCDDHNEAINNNWYSTTNDYSNWATESCENHADNQDDISLFTNVVYATIFMLLVLPFVYIYFWIVVHSLRHYIIQSRMVVIPMQPPAIMIQSMPPVNEPYGQQPPPYQSQPMYGQPHHY